MIIFPAIDIKDGVCVRLIKGDFRQITSYENTPIDQARKYFQNGFNNIHSVDLDGALHGRPVNSILIREIVQKVKSKIQIGGGIRTIDDINSWIEMGVDKVVMGTAAVENTELLETACNKFKNKIAVSLDVKDGLIALSGWKKQTNISAIDFIKKIQNFGVSRIIYTDINRDGTKQGPNIKDTVELSSKATIPLIITGGIYSLEDINLNQLDELPSTFEEVQLTEEEEKYFEENGINLKLENANHNDPIVEIKALDKISAKTTTLKIKIGETINFENLQIKPK